MTVITKEELLSEMKTRFCEALDSLYGFQLVIDEEYNILEMATLQPLVSPTTHKILALISTQMMEEGKYENLPKDPADLYKQLDAKLGEGWRSIPVTNFKSDPNDVFDWGQIASIYMVGSNISYQINSFFAIMAALALNYEIIVTFNDEGQPSIQFPDTFSEIKSVVDEIVAMYADKLAERRIELEAENEAVLNRVRSAVTIDQDAANAPELDPAKPE
ncbi:hypothetical protein CPT_Moabite_154 [Serratia phage Moabite]|uniref:Uncharacterized protein n=1 Tax=Serratia phage Moabite TaxID=2587814 RepID=A0A4Y5TP80_9CAUD|nr:hypothetical protein HWC48_gp262 [Serratia phage Moabite]QDB71184.1 hypothetical protein CPT_Moabite_154 [Serratia phage Moabite]UQT03548.1 hypothetical protein KODAMA_00810 [Serratia phage vB_SmaM-Kodama]URG14252.1 hypothetical protein [Pectobacterium phage vB_ParM-25]